MTEFLNHLKILDINTGQQTFLEHDEGYIFSIDVSPNGLIVVLYVDRWIDKLTVYKDNKIISTFTNLFSSYYARVDKHFLGNKLVFWIHGSQALKISNLLTGTIEMEKELPGINDINILPNGEVIISFETENVAIWNIDTDNYRNIPMKGAMQNIRVFPNGQILVDMDDDSMKIFG